MYTNNSPTEKQTLYIWSELLRFVMTIMYDLQEPIEHSWNTLKKTVPAYDSTHKNICKL